MKKQKPKKYGLTFFIFIVPSLLLGMSAAITDVLVRLPLQVVVLLLQVVLIKNLLDDYYGI